jgi:hypothetical protein
LSWSWKHEPLHSPHKDWNLVAADSQNQTNLKPFLFSFPYTLSKQLSIKTEHTAWSKGVSLPTIGDAELVELEAGGVEGTKLIHHRIELSVSISRSENPTVTILTYISTYHTSFGGLTSFDLRHDL